MLFRAFSPHAYCAIAGADRASRHQLFGALALRRQRPADRALALGCALGGDVSSAAFPFAEALWGAEALRAAALLHAPAAAAAAVAAPAAFAAGRAAEEGRGSRKHLDGGSYDGDWLVGQKDGAGVYVYARHAAFALASVAKC